MKVSKFNLLSIITLIILVFLLVKVNRSKIDLEYKYKQVKDSLICYHNLLNKEMLNYKNIQFINSIYLSNIDLNKDSIILLKNKIKHEVYIRHKVELNFLKLQERIDSILLEKGVP
jgi:hypothetical protein